MIARYSALLFLLCAGVCHALGQQQASGQASTTEERGPDDRHGTGTPNELPTATLAIPGTLPRTATAGDVNRSEPTAVARKTGSDEVSPPPSDFPVRTDTGDPAADDARHLAAKQAWMNEHPGAYMDYMRAMRARTPRPHE
jgi:hypothetical protein